MSFCDIIQYIKVEIMPTRLCGFFISCDPLLRVFFYKKQQDKHMQMKVINNPDESQVAVYNAARVIYAETYPTTLPVVEAMASMIYNIHIKYNKSFEDIANDSDLFESFHPEAS